jgi:hypothetical protein
MSADSTMNLRERLNRCSLQELKNKIYRSAGNLARLTGNKAALVQRLLEMSSNMSAEEYSRIFPEMRPRPSRTVHSSRPQTMRGSSATSGTRLQIRRPRINVVATSPSRSSSTRPLSSVRAPLEETPEQLLLRRTLETQAGLIIQEISQLASPRPTPLRRSNTNPAFLTPARRPRAASASSSERRGPEVQLQAQQDSVFLECKICFDEQINTVLLPCGHACCCWECSVRLKFASWDSSCPLCRANIESVSKIYFN